MPRRLAAGLQTLALTLTLTVALLLVLPAAALASERPPRDALPLSTIVLSLEKQGFGPIVDVEFDNGVWEIEAYRDGRKRELRVDPLSGRILSDRPDD